jgi:hypothetical protein
MDILVLSNYGKSNHAWRNLLPVCNNDDKAIPPCLVKEISLDSESGRSLFSAVIAGNHDLKSLLGQTSLSNQHRTKSRELDPLVLQSRSVRTFQPVFPKIEKQLGFTDSIVEIGALTPRSASQARRASRPGHHRRRKDDEDRMMPSMTHFKLTNRYAVSQRQLRGMA